MSGVNSFSGQNKISVDDAAVKSLRSFSISIKKDKCKGCALCVFYCPVKHLKISEELNKRGQPTAEVKAETKCIGCGLCFSVCPDVCIQICEE